MKVKLSENQLEALRLLVARGGQVGWWESHRGSLNALVKRGLATEIGSGQYAITSDGRLYLAENK